MEAGRECPSSSNARIAAANSTPRNVDCPYCGGEETTIRRPGHRTDAYRWRRRTTRAVVHTSLAWWPLLDHVRSVRGVRGCRVCRRSRRCCPGACHTGAPHARTRGGLRHAHDRRVSSRRPWGRWVAIAFILWNTAIGVGALVERDRGGLFGVGAGVERLSTLPMAVPDPQRPRAFQPLNAAAIESRPSRLGTRVDSRTIAGLSIRDAPAQPHGALASRLRWRTYACRTISRRARYRSPWRPRVRK